MRARLLAEAKRADGTLETDVPGTNHGRLACAWAVNHVAKLAFGREIGGGLSTIKMHEALEEKHIKVAGDAKPGTVIISPTEGSNVGRRRHPWRGSRERPAREFLVYSNWSSTHTFGHAFTLKSWKQYYGEQKGLPVDFFDSIPLPSKIA